MNRIDKTAEKLRKGWGKRDYYYNGRYCLVGGLAQTIAEEQCEAGEHTTMVDVAYGARLSKSPEGRLLIETIVEQFPDRVSKERGIDLGTVVGFNDSPHTTLEDVLLVCEKASAKLDEKV